MKERIKSPLFEHAMRSNAPHTTSFTSPPTPKPGSNFSFPISDSSLSEPQKNHKTIKGTTRYPHAPRTSTNMHSRTYPPLPLPLPKPRPGPRVGLTPRTKLLPRTNWRMYPKVYSSTQNPAPLAMDPEIQRARVLGD